MKKPGPVVEWMMISAVALVAAYGGIRLRQWFYTATEDHHFPGDIRNAWEQGSSVYDDGVILQADGKPLRWRYFWKAYFGRYDKVMAESPDGDYGLDYPPARLLIMCLWVKSEKSKFFPFFSDSSDVKFAGPLLWIDNIAELLSAVMAFLVVRLVSKRWHSGKTNCLGLAAGLLLWFDPTVLVDRMWPQWDSWVLPFYLLAAYLALNRRWLFVGICLGVGMMFKGQVICTAAVFVLWPLFQGKFRAALEVIVGALAAALVCVSPWLIRSPWAGIPLVVIIGGALFGVRYIPKQWRVLAAVASAPIALLVSAISFGGSFGWWLVPFVYSSHHFLSLGMGTPVNLPMLLSQRWDWQLEDLVYDGTRFHLQLRTLLVIIYAATLALCALGIALQDKRNDRRILIALATPWILMFTFLPQMHERYLYWGAALSVLAVGVSLGTTLLHFVITGLSCVAMLTWLYRGDDSDFSRFLHGMFPDCAWALILIALIFLYLSITPGPIPNAARESRQPSAPPSEAV